MREALLAGDESVQIVVNAMVGLQSLPIFVIPLNGQYAGFSKYSEYKEPH